MDRNQIVELSRREVCWVKYGNALRFECGAGTINSSTTRSITARWRQQRFLPVHDGRWLARRLPAGATGAAPWMLDVRDNQLVWFDAACRIDPVRVASVSVPARAWFEPRRDAGSDLDHATRWCCRTNRTIRRGGRRRRALLFRSSGRLVRMGALGIPRSLQPRRRLQHAYRQSVWCQTP